MCFTMSKFLNYVLALIRGDVVVHYERAPFNMDDNLEDEFCDQYDNNSDNDSENDSESNSKIEIEMKNVVNELISKTILQSSTEKSAEKSTEKSTNTIESMYYTANEIESSDSDEEALFIASIFV